MVCLRGDSLTQQLQAMIKKFSTTIAFVSLLCVSSACSSQSISSLELTNFCKQLIGDVMGRDPGSMIADQVSADITSISYVRDDDAKEFKYQCKEEEGDIIWRGVDIFGPGEGPGRWRNEDARAITSFQ